MAQQEVFEIMVLHRDKDGKAEVIVEQQNVTASSESTARLIAGREVPEEWADKMDELEVRVRTFR